MTDASADGYAKLGSRTDAGLPDLVSAAQCAAYAQAAYSGDPTWSAGDCYAYGFKGPAPGVLVVAFRGTNPAKLSDLLSDLDALPETHPQLGRCHRGFLRNVLGVSDNIMTHTTGQQLVIVGHSKGAAEAALFAGLLAAAGRAPVQLTTFGMPKVGGGALRQLVMPLRGQDFRNGGDPVTQVPLFFFHPRALRQLGQDAPLAVSYHLMTAYAKAVAAF